MVETFHEFIPKEKELVYSAIYKSDPIGSPKCHLSWITIQGRKEKGLFLHSGSSLKVDLNSCQKDTFYPKSS